MQALGALIVKCTRDVVFICYALIALALAALYGLTRRETWVKPGDHERKQLDEGENLERLVGHAVKWH